jgi:APA family basic amino acid/polyamine antiporter
MEEKQLVRGMGLIDATAIVVGSMIGSGIFIAPSIMAGVVQSPLIILLLFVVGGVLTVFGALCFGELSAAMPRSGGMYVFLREAYSPIIGFLFGWTLFLVIQSGLIAAVAVAFAKYLGVFFPAVSENIGLVGIPVFGRVFTISTAQSVAMLSICLLTAVNCLGVRAGAFVQNLFTFLKILAIFLLVALAFLSSKGSFVNIATDAEPLIPETLKVGFLAAMAVAISKALFAYDGWTTGTFAAEEVRDPQKNLPIALIAGTAVVTLIYVLTTASYFYLFPAQDAAAVADNRIAAAAAQMILGPAGLYFISAAILISTFGCNNGLILGGARVYYGMARDGLFFKGAADVSSRYRVPAKALVYQGIWASILTLTGTYSDLLTYEAFGAVLFTGLAVVGLIVLRKRQPALTRPYRVSGYPFVPIIYILIAVTFLIYIIKGDPVNSGKGIALILLGIPVYGLWRFRSRRV